MRERLPGRAHVRRVFYTLHGLSFKYDCKPWYITSSRSYTAKMKTAIAALCLVLGVAMAMADEYGHQSGYASYGGYGTGMYGGYSGGYGGGYGGGYSGYGQGYGHGYGHGYGKGHSTRRTVVVPYPVPVQQQQAIPAPLGGLGGGLAGLQAGLSDDNQDEGLFGGSGSSIILLLFVLGLLLSNSSSSLLG